MLPLAIRVDVGGGIFQFFFFCLYHVESAMVVSPMRTVGRPAGRDTSRSYIHIELPSLRSVVIMYRIYLATVTVF